MAARTTPPVWCNPAGAGGQFAAGERCGPERLGSLVCAGEPRFCISERWVGVKSSCLCVACRVVMAPWAPGLIWVRDRQRGGR
jgi:hypothetical protein